MKIGQKYLTFPSGKVSYDNLSLAKPNHCLE